MLTLQFWVERQTNSWRQSCRKTCQVIRSRFSSIALQCGVY
jgi:hypothetical protein